ncbi:DegT/DnrJ/EryC1/StrS family aminotransferase [Streptomyces sp. CC224B]|uniref:DegT/DnrJ/EryC1/StrS family aminotransferase n=1 Tax=Streptomyces sp. CC224B TaxID=3044571 RepID=UPI0024A85E12|nr:DegT/DnrJ/EryC1/StrS family aminotransferase [Streptomyces sp. CC224B]
MQSTHAHHLLTTEPTLRFTPATPHPAWSRAVRGVVARLARAERAPLTAKATATTTADGLRRERLTFDSPLRGTFHGTVTAPQDATGPRPAVLVLGGKNARMEQLTGETTPDFPDRNVAEHLARAGFVTLSFEHGIGDGLDEERRAGRDEGALLAHAFALTGRSLLGALVGDALGALDVLAAHPLTVPDRVGLFGHSLGAAVALHTALLAPRPLPVCAASHLGSYPALYHRLLTGYEGAVLPGVLEYADLPDLYGALAPAPLQLQYGTADPYLEPADARAAAEAVRRAHTAAGGDLEVRELAMGHGTHVRYTTEFFARTLAGPPPAPADVPAQRVHFDVSDRRAVLDRVDAALASGHLTQGPELVRFEGLARTWTGAESVAVASGAAALEIALRVIGVAGRTVLVPVNTFFATAAAAVRAGATVRFLDIEPDGLGPDPEALRAALDRHPDTAAVLPVHIGGIVSPALDEVLALCAERGVPVVEDAAHALGATLRGRFAGSFGRFGAFSFFPTKVAVSGEGGLVTCPGGDAAADAEQVRRWRDHGKSAQGSTLHDRPGGNWRMSELHAAVGAVDLERFGRTLATRRELAGAYDALLADVPGLRAHVVPSDARSNYYKYLARLDASVDRAALKQRLRERHGVALAGEVYDHLLCDQPYFADAAAPPGGGTTSSAAAEDPYPQARRFARHHIALPLYPTLTRDEQTRVVAALRAELS